MTVYLLYNRLSTAKERLSRLPVVNSSGKEYPITQIINYIRKSRRDEEREKRTGEDTLDEQKRLMCRVLNDLAIPYDQFFEIGSGDSIQTRPVFQEVLKYIREDKYDAVAVKEISRLGRGSYEDTGLIMDLLQEKRIFIITPYRTYDPNNTSDARQIRFELFMAREEYEQIKERMIGARYNYALQGKWMTGSVPFGYTLNKHSQRLELNERQAKLVKLIFELYTYGVENRPLGFKALSNHLRKLGIKTPRNADVWDPTQLKRMVSNPAYIGHVRFSQTERRKGKVYLRPKEEHIYVENAHEPLIDAEVFYEAQKKLNRSSITSHPSFGLQVSELTGLMICGGCGRKLIINRSKRTHQKKDGDLSIYFDHFLRCRNSCLSVRYEPIEEKVVGILDYFHKIDHETLHLSLQGMIKKNSVQNQVYLRRNEEIIQEITTKKKELTKRRNFVYQKFEEGIYSHTTFIERKSVIEQELAEVMQLELSLTAGKDESASSTDPVDTLIVKNNLSHILTIYKNANSSEIKNQILRSLFHEIQLVVIKKGNVKQPAKVKLSPIFKHAITEKLHLA